MRPREKQTPTETAPTTLPPPNLISRASAPENASSAAPRSWKGGFGRRRSDAPSSSTTTTSVSRGKAPATANHASSTSVKTTSTAATSTNKPPEPLQAILSHEDAQAANPSGHPRPSSLLSSSPRHSAGDDSPSTPSTPDRKVASAPNYQVSSNSVKPNLPTPPPPAAFKRLRHHHSPGTRRSDRPLASGSRQGRAPSAHSHQPALETAPSSTITNGNAAASVPEGGDEIWFRARPLPRISASDEPSRTLSLDSSSGDAQPASSGYEFSMPRSVPLTRVPIRPVSTRLPEIQAQREVLSVNQRPGQYLTPYSFSSLSAPVSADPSTLSSATPSSFLSFPRTEHHKPFLPVSSGPPLRTSELTHGTPSLEHDQRRDKNQVNENHSQIDRPSTTLYTVQTVPPGAPSDSGLSHDSSVCGGTGGGKSRTRYHKIFGSAGRFAFFRRQSAGTSEGVLTDGGAAAYAHTRTTSRAGASDEAVFGTRQQEDPRRQPERPGEQILAKFIRSTLGPNAESLAIRLMNKTPIMSSEVFSYEIHQGTEDPDLDIIRRDLMCGRLYTSGLRLLGGAWCNLLLGDRFAPGSSPRQRHELTYRRSMCSCIICLVESVKIVQATLSAAEANGKNGLETSDTDSNAASVDVVSAVRLARRTPLHSAMANFVVLNRLPSKSELLSVGAQTMSKELEIGSVVRLNSRASAKLKFTDDVRELFRHLAYTGPISHEKVFRDVTTIGVSYYMFNKGKKERKVYIQGDLIRLPLNVGVVKLGTQPMYLSEVGSMFCLYRKQIMSIYTGEIVLEGNSLGTFIKTGLQYYIGFGEERGVCPVFANKTLGPARKLGINEILLHHHMVDDLIVKCM